MNIGMTCLICQFTDAVSILQRIRAKEVPEGVGGDRGGVRIEDPIDLPSGQVAIPASWEQVGIFRLWPTPKILPHRIHHLVAEVHHPHLIPLTMPHRDFPGLQRDILHSKFQALTDP